MLGHGVLSSLDGTYKFEGDYEHDNPKGNFLIYYVDAENLWIVYANFIRIVEVKPPEEEKSEIVQPPNLKTDKSKKDLPAVEGPPKTVLNYEIGSVPLSFEVRVFLLTLIFLGEYYVSSAWLRRSSATFKRGNRRNDKASSKRC